MKTAVKHDACVPMIFEPLMIQRKEVLPANRHFALVFTLNFEVHIQSVYSTVNPTELLAFTTLLLLYSHFHNQNKNKNKFWTPLPPSTAETGRMGLLGMKYKSHPSAAIADALMISAQRSA